MRKLRFHLAQLLDDKKETSATAAKKTGLTKRGIELLRATPKKEWGIKADTIERICHGLGVELGELLTLEEPTAGNLGCRYLIEEKGGDVTIALGTVPVALTSPQTRRVRSIRVLPEIRREAIGVWDVRALSEVMKECAWADPRIEQAQCTKERSRGAVARNVRKDNERPDYHETILRVAGTKGTVISLGSPLVSGFADYVLCQLYDEKRQPKGWKLPFKFCWNFSGEDRQPSPRPFNSYTKTGSDPQGILWNDKMLLEIPTWSDIFALRRGRTYSDGAVIFLQRAQRGQAYWLLLMGFSGPGTLAAARFLRTGDFAERLQVYLAQLNRVPMCIALEVVCKKTGSEDSYEVEPVETKIAKHAPDL